METKPCRNAHTCAVNCCTGSVLKHLVSKVLAISCFSFAFARNVPFELLLNCFVVLLCDLLQFLFCYFLRFQLRFVSHLLAIRFHVCSGVLLHVKELFEFMCDFIVVLSIVCDCRCVFCFAALDFVVHCACVRFRMCSLSLAI